MDPILFLILSGPSSTDFLQGAMAPCSGLWSTYESPTSENLLTWKGKGKK